MPTTDVYLFPGEVIVGDLKLRPSAPDSSSTLYNRSVSETITTTTDSPARQVVLARALSEALTAANDAVARMLAGSRVTVETISPVSDAVTRVLMSARLVSETAPSASDASARFVVMSRLTSEAITAAADALGRTVQRQRTIAETIAAAFDTVTRIAPSHIIVTATARNLIVIMPNRVLTLPLLGPRVLTVTTIPRTVQMLANPRTLSVTAPARTMTALATPRNLVVLGTTGGTVNQLTTDPPIEPMAVVEDLIWGIDVTPNLGGAVPIAVSGALFDVTGNASVSLPDAATVAGNIVSQRIRAGTLVAGHTYRLSVLFTPQGSTNKLTSYLTLTCPF